jgi:hypothetical protein
MADTPIALDDVTPAVFFAQLLPAGFAAQVEAGAPVPKEFRLQYHLTGEGGGSWLVAIAEGTMTTTPGVEDAHVTVTVSIDDWRDAVLGRNGAVLALVLPQGRPGRPDTSARARQLKGTLALELAREAPEPFRVEMCFSGTAAPRGTIRMKIADYVAMSAGALNGQEAFMTGRLRYEGDPAFLMQIASLNM